jgi:hypothetical protein
MGFLDKVKEQAAVASAAAMDVAQKGQAKLDYMAAKKAADGLLRDLGAVVYTQHSGRGTDTSEAEKTRLFGALESHEKEHGPLQLSSQPAASGDGAGSGS